MSSLNHPQEHSASDYHRVLADSQRRLILSILQEERQYAVADLAKEIASRKQNPSIEGIDLDLAKRIQRLLYHRHLPMMADAGLIRFDEDTKVVELAGSPSPEN